MHSLRSSHRSRKHLHGHGLRQVHQTCALPLRTEDHLDLQAPLEVIHQRQLQLKASQSILGQGLPGALKLGQVFERVKYSKALL